MQRSIGGVGRKLLDSCPPNLARVNCLIQEVINWCSQNRPELQSLMTPSRIRQLMNAVTEATLGMSGVQVYGDQATFFQSEEGIKYSRALSQGVNAYKKSLS